MDAETPLFSLQREKTTDKSTGLRQPELIIEWWEEQYPLDETEPFPLPTHTTRPWWNRNRGDDV